MAEITTQDLDRNKILKIGYAEVYVKTGGNKHKAHLAVGQDFSEDFETISLIKELQEHLRQNAAISLEQHLEKLAMIRDEAMFHGKLSVALSAEVARGKAAGLYVEKHSIDLNNVTNSSAEDLRKRLMEINQRLQGTPVKHVEELDGPANFIDVTPDREPESEPVRRKENSTGTSG